MIAHLLFSSFGIIFAFKSNERFYHMDMIFKIIDPNLIVNTRSSSNPQDEDVKIKIFQALILDKLDYSNIDIADKK